MGCFNNRFEGIHLAIYLPRNVGVIKMNFMKQGHLVESCHRPA